MTTHAYGNTCICAYFHAYVLSCIHVLSCICVGMHTSRYVLHCMGCITWIALHGLQCMGCIAWVALHLLHYISFCLREGTAAQRRATRFVKGRYGMFESVMQMLEQLTWTPLSKRRENSRLILFYIINNLAVVSHSCLEKADVRTRKKHSQKFRHIGYNIDPYGQSFFPNCITISAWNGLAKDIVEANTLDKSCKLCRKRRILELSSRII